MRYRTAGAFRQALEERLRERSLGKNQVLTRLRKTVAFDRFLARLTKRHRRAWIIKGGFALQLRLPDRPRTTKDLDAAVAEEWSEEQIISGLHRAVAMDLGDWFEFEIGQPSAVATGAPFGGLRFPIRCLLDGRQFETFHLDLGQGDPLSDAPEELMVPRLLDFAQIAPTRVPCYPLAAQIAEKLHAYTRTYPRGTSSRVRDLVDILLIASLASLSSRKLRRAIQATFQARGTHHAPQQLPEPPGTLLGPFRKLARELNLAWPTITAAGQAAAQFLNPVLRESAAQRWDPSGWKWD